jgi:hypothetical protein
MPATSACRCDELSLLKDLQADAYSEHLVTEEVEDGGRVVWLRCPQSQRKWVQTFRELDGQQLSLELRRSMSAAELVEHLARMDADERLEWMHHDVEFTVPGHDETYRGLDQARAWTAAAAADPNLPAGQAFSLIEVDESRAVVLGGLSFMRDGVRSEHRPAGWLVELKHGTVKTNRWFDSWDAARRAAGLPEGDTSPGKRLGRWAFSVVRSMRPGHGRTAVA